MKIGYDAKRFFLNNTGLGNYSRWLIKNVVQHYPQNEYFLYTPKVKADSRLNFLGDHNNIKTVTPKISLLTSIWRSSGITGNLKHDGIDVYHGLSHELPLGIGRSSVQSVVTVHDLIFMRLPETFGWINRLIYANKVKYACKVADKIIAISQKTKDDLVSFLHVDPDKIEVIYQGADPIFSSLQSDAQKEVIKLKYSLPEKFMLNVGTIEARKNLQLIVNALPYVKDDIPLVVVGKQTKYFDQVMLYLATNKLTQRVIFLHNVEFQHLPAIYQMASVFIYPSRYEGFGLPVLEALCSGTPVIAATGSCLAEAGGPDSFYVDPDDEIDLGKKINLILADEKLRQNMITSGFQYSSNFEAVKLSQQLMTLYSTITHA